MANGYKKCPNGHFYKDDLAQCPYCDRDVSFRVAEDFKEEDESDISRIDDSKLKLCPNQHAYDNSLDECPYCGERQVDGFVSDDERFLIYKTSMNTLNKDEVISIIHVTKNGNVTHTTTYTFDKGLNIEVGFIGNAILYYDVHSDFNRSVPEIVECEISIGNEKMTGREFILKIDEMLKKEIGVNGRIDLSSIDENKIVKDCSRRFYPGRENPSYESLKEIQVIKVCPQGHGYSEEEQTCPFCGNAQVVSTQKGVTWENTIYYDDFWYEEEGVQISIFKAIVDGAEIAGDIRMRVYYTGSFKYRYCVAEFDQIANELRVTPESKVILIGDGFSKTYLGCEFYEMCDKLFEKFENYKDTISEHLHCPSDKNDEVDSYNNLNLNVSMVECPNGHFYPASLDKCPYCIEEMEMKVCPNHHTYPVEKDECPFCGETFVVDHCKRSSQDTIWEEDIKILEENPFSKRILVNGHEYTNFYCLSISFTHGHRYSYNIRLERAKVLSKIEIKPEDSIVFGRTPMTGKEFIKMCDVLLDNRVVLLLNKLETKIDLNVQLSFADLYNKMG